MTPATGRLRHVLFTIAVILFVAVGPWVSGTAPGGAAVTPVDTNEIAYLIDNTTIGVIDADGTHARTITPTLTHGEEITGGLDLSPDGTKLLYTASFSFITCTSDIFVIDTDGSNQLSFPVRLPGGGCEYEPRWSPDGTKVVFAVESAENATGVWIANADGSNPVRISADGREPFWSPGGGYVVFEDDAQQIVSVSVSTGQRRQLTSLPGDSREPIWSPDGRHIVFQYSPPESGDPGITPTQTMIMNFDGTGLKTLFTTMGPGGTASWAPDSSRLITDYAHESPSAITIVSLDGTVQRQLPSGNDPTWIRQPGTDPVFRSPPTTTTTMAANHAGTSTTVATSATTSTPAPSTSTSASRRSTYRRTRSSGGTRLWWLLLIPVGLGAGATWFWRRRPSRNQ